MRCHDRARHIALYAENITILCHGKNSLYNLVMKNGASKTASGVHLYTPSGPPKVNQHNLERFPLFSGVFRGGIRRSMQWRI